MYIKELLLIIANTTRQNRKRCAFLHGSYANIMPVCIHDKHIVCTLVLQ